MVIFLVLGVGRKRTQRTHLKALLLGEIPSKMSSLMEKKRMPIEKEESSSSSYF
jgi:hypothetical protein